MYTAEEIGRSYVRFNSEEMAVIRQWLGPRLSDDDEEYDRIERAIHDVVMALATVSATTNSWRLDDKFVTMGATK